MTWRTTVSAFESRPRGWMSSQGWCVAYFIPRDEVSTYYEGARMCEGRPDPMIEP